MTLTLERDFYRLPSYVVGPPIFGAFALDDIVDWGQRIHKVSEHWKHGQGESILVGVLDTGRPVHSDVSEAVVKSANFSKSYTDVDLIGHGTHVCGTIAARSNGRGVVGVAPKTKLCVAKVLGDDASGSSSAVTDGIHFCVEQGCQIISMSLGGGYNSALDKAIQTAIDNNIIVVCAVGNSGESRNGKSRVSYPARDSRTIAVASYNKKGQLSSYSSRGDEVTVAFPGEDVLSCWLNEGYRRMSGTSMATPFAAGLMALSLEIHPERNSNEKILKRLQKVAVDKGEIGHDTGWGWGVIDVAEFFKFEAPHPIDGEVLGGVRVRYPVTVEGHTGAFIYLPK